MSPAKKITRHIIRKEEIPAFIFLGIVSAEPDYRLSVMLNRHLGSDFRKGSENITAISDKGTNSFSCFISTQPALKLVSNKSGEAVFMRKLGKMDFLLVPGRPSNRKNTEDLATMIRKIPEVTAVFVFNSREISDRNVSLLAL
jgi:hypothetical protein